MRSERHRHRRSLGPLGEVVRRRREDVRRVGGQDAVVAEEARLDLDSSAALGAGRLHVQAPGQYATRPHLRAEARTGIEAARLKDRWRRRQYGRDRHLS